MVSKEAQYGDFPRQVRSYLELKAKDPEHFKKPGWTLDHLKGCYKVATGGDPCKSWQKYQVFDKLCKHLDIPMTKDVESLVPGARVESNKKRRKFTCIQEAENIISEKRDKIARFVENNIEDLRSGKILHADEPGYAADVEDGNKTKPYYFYTNKKVLEFGESFRDVFEALTYLEEPKNQPI